jgi:hypothetical protein
MSAAIIPNTRKAAKIESNPQVIAHDTAFNIPHTPLNPVLFIPFSNIRVKRDLRKLGLQIASPGLSYSHLFHEGFGLDNRVGQRLLSTLDSSN